MSGGQGLGLTILWGTFPFAPPSLTMPSAPQAIYLGSLGKAVRIGFLIPRLSKRK